MDSYSISISQILHDETEKIVETHELGLQNSTRDSDPESHE
jgi:hypothetical protein